jgi:hypothetical protein
MTNVVRTYARAADGAVFKTPSGGMVLDTGHRAA